MSTIKMNTLNREEVLGLRGLRLPARALKQLQKTGIFCEPSVSIEHQHLAGRYVLRGRESGGAVPELGHYVGFAGVNGDSLSWLQRVDSIARNGLHAIAIAPEFTRLQIFRMLHSYDLLITRHSLVTVTGTKRPTMCNEILFHGVQGFYSAESCTQRSNLRDEMSPIFLTRSGEPMIIPESFRVAVARLTAAAWCVGCHHCHLLQPRPPYSATPVEQTS